LDGVGTVLVDHDDNIQAAAARLKAEREKAKESDGKPKNKRSVHRDNSRRNLANSKARAERRSFLLLERRQLRY